MKKVLFVLGLVCSMATLNAQVTRGTVGTANFTDYSGTTTQRMGLDFNNDGTNEFAINNGYDMNTGDPIANGAVEYVYSSTNNVVTDAEMWDYFKLLANGTSVNVSSGFNGQGDCYFEDYNAIGSSAFVGFRVKVGSSMHYGYAKVSYSNSTVTWNEIYYNATPSAAITVGATSGGQTAIDNAEANHFVAAAMSGHRVNIMQANAETIRVYDIAGRKVAETRELNSTLTLPAAGTYILRSATTSAKIVVL